MKLCIMTNSKVLISNMTVTFSNYGLYGNKVILIQNSKSLLHETSHVDKVEGADFEYDNSSFYFWQKDTQIRHFWYEV